MAHLTTILIDHLIVLYLWSGYSPSDLMEKTQADMIFDGVEDLRVAMSKFYFEENEAKKVR